MMGAKSTHYFQRNDTLQNETIGDPLLCRMDTYQNDGRMSSRVTRMQISIKPIAEWTPSRMTFLVIRTQIFPETFSRMDTLAWHYKTE